MFLCKIVVIVILEIICIIFLVTLFVQLLGFIKMFRLDCARIAFKIVILAMGALRITVYRVCTLFTFILTFACFSAQVVIIQIIFLKFASNAIHHAIIVILIFIIPRHWAVV